MGIIELRKFKNSDLGSILSVWENASKLAHSFLSEEFFEKERYNIPNIYIPNADTLVAENEGNVIGFISMIDNEIGGLFVDPEFHGVGVGTSLVDKVREIHCMSIPE
ncbi:MAG: GNAT family N-acetyltransferase [Clostridiales bacterium]|nr:GNAT family N-acetyltransferase [Clostridiales bacterium]